VNPRQENPGQVKPGQANTHTSEPPDKCEDAIHHTSIEHDVESTKFLGIHIDKNFLMGPYTLAALLNGSPY